MESVEEVLQRTERGMTVSGLRGDGRFDHCKWPLAVSTPLVAEFTDLRRRCHASFYSVWVGASPHPIWCVRHLNAVESMWTREAS